MIGRHYKFDHMGFQYSLIITDALGLLSHLLKLFEKNGSPPMEKKLLEVKASLAYALYATAEVGNRSSHL